MTDPVSRMSGLRISERSTAHVQGSDISLPPPSPTHHEDDTFFAGDHPGAQGIEDVLSDGGAVSRSGRTTPGSPRPAFHARFRDVPSRPQTTAIDVPMKSLVLHQRDGLSHALKLRNKAGQASHDRPSIVLIPVSACITGLARNDGGRVPRGIHQGAFVCVTTMNLVRLAGTSRLERANFVRALESKMLDCHYRYIAPLGVLDAPVAAGSALWHGLTGPTTVRASAVAFVAAKAREDYWGEPRNNAASAGILEVSRLETFDDIIKLGAIPSFSQKSLKRFFSASVDKMVNSHSTSVRSNLRDNLAESIARLAWAVGKKTGNMTVLEDLMKVRDESPMVLGARLGIALSVASYMDKLRKEKSADREFYIGLGASVVKAAVGSVPFAGPALGELVSILENVTKKCLEDKSSASVLAQKNEKYYLRYNPTRQRLRSRKC